jgi:hydrogenase maturation factor
MTPDGAARSERNHASHCITCSDEGLAMDVVAVDEERGTALCADAEGARQTVEAALVAPPLQAGDRVLVHAGVALLRLQEAPA